MPADAVDREVLVRSWLVGPIAKPPSLLRKGLAPVRRQVPCGVPAGLECVSLSFDQPGAPVEMKVLSLAWAGRPARLGCIDELSEPTDRDLETVQSKGRDRRRIPWVIVLEEAPTRYEQALAAILGTTRTTIRKAWPTRCTARRKPLLADALSTLHAIFT